VTQVYTCYYIKKDDLNFIFKSMKDTLSEDPSVNSEKNLQKSLDILKTSVKDESKL
tara:strand:- start:681 stop:848 length:168 start_codon:yes stop_codon:yes gene_type:complete